MSISSLHFDHEVEAVQLPAANGETKNRQPLPGHPLLRTWNPPSKHKFEGSQLRTFSSICDTFSPSIEPPTDRQGDICPENGRHSVDFSRDKSKTVEDVEAFYRCSATALGVPKDIAGMLGAVLQPKVLMGIRLFIWLLSTRLGTVILCGRNGLSKTFPYFQVFSYLPRNQQEKVLEQWSRSSFTIFQAVYKLFKMLTLWAVYCKIDKNGHNRLWKAIGYCGPDPEVVNRKVSTKPSNRLKDRVVDVTTAGDKLAKILNQTGCNVLDKIDHLRTLMIHKRTGEGKSSTCSEAIEDIGISCDVVVVGSGCGGGVMAAVLAKAGYKVVILEKGKYFAREDFSTFEGPSQMIMYEKLGSLATDDGGVNLVAGATVGGGTVINWSVCFKTPQHVLEEWSESSGLDLFTSPRYKQAMEEVWERLGTQSGSVHNENFQNRVLREGCQKMGTEVGTLARNASSDHKCGWCTYGCSSGEKKSTAESWLVDAVNSGNAVILSGCEAQAVLHCPNPHGKKKKQARGAVAKIGDGPRKIFIEARATIVACGSLFTPPLLLNSGLSNPSIGKSLHLHPALFVWGYFPEGCGPPGTCYEGPIMSAYSPVYKGNSRIPCGLLETMSPHPGSFATFMPWTSGTDFKERMRRYSRTATLCMVTRDDQSHGSVGVDATGAPTFKYTLSAPDEDTVLVGLEQGLRVLIAAGAVEIGTHQQDGERFHAEGASEQEIEAYMARVRARGVRKLQISMASGHQMGSCRMGADPARSTVDAQGEAWEVQGLYVGDASVFPGALGVNPMVTIQSLAFCTAHSVVASLQCASE